MQEHRLFEKVKRSLNNSLDCWDTTRILMKDANVIVHIHLCSLMLQENIVVEEDDFITKITEVKDDNDRTKFIKSLNISNCPGRLLDCVIKLDLECKTTRNWEDCIYYKIKCL